MLSRRTRCMLCTKMGERSDGGLWFQKGCKIVDFLNRCILSFNFGEWLQFSYIYGGVFIGYRGSYSPNTYYLQFENCAGVKPFGFVKWTYMALSCTSLFDWCWSCKVFAPNSSRFCKTKKFGGRQEVVATSEIFDTFFICAHITRKCFDWFWSIKNSWKAFWTY